MNHLFAFIIIFLSSSVFADQLCLPADNSFSAQKIEKNVVTGKYQISLPDYDVGSARAIPVTVSEGSKAHLCKFFGLSGGRVLSSKIDCEVRRQLFIEKDGSYREIHSDNSFGCAKDYYIAMLECDDSEN